jgi:hypothetical protein
MIWPGGNWPCCQWQKCHIHRKWIPCLSKKQATNDRVKTLNAHREITRHNPTALKYIATYSNDICKTYNSHICLFSSTKLLIVPQVFLIFQWPDSNGINYHRQLNDILIDQILCKCLKILETPIRPCTTKCSWIELWWCEYCLPSFTPFLANGEWIVFVHVM